MILKELNPILCLMKITGYFVYPKGRKSRITQRLLTVYIFIFIIINLSLCLHNAMGINLLRQHLGLWHQQTISFAIQGLKPLHAVANLAVFFYNRNYFEKIRVLLVDIDEHFNRSFEYKLRIRYKYLHVLLLVLMFFVVPFGIRLSLYLLLSERLGANWLSDVSLIIVPMLSLWQMVPLYFYYMTTSVLCQWFDYLNSQLEMNIVPLSAQGNSIAIPLKDYVSIWKKLSKAVFLVGSFFNHFVFFSIFISLGVLCGTINYITGAKDIFYTAKTLPYQARLGKYYFLIWTGLQVLAAVAYILIFCYNGWRTNEASRRIAPLVLSLFPSTSDVKYLVDQVVHRIFTQYNWGISIWRISLVERSLLLTFSSGIVTYALVLLKLQPTPCECPPAQIAQNFTG